MITVKQLRENLLEQELRSQDWSDLIVLCRRVQEFLDNPDPDLEYHFKCPDCGETSPWTMGRVPENGSPMCTDCDQEMELI